MSEAVAEQVQALSESTMTPEALEAIKKSFTDNLLNMYFVFIEHIKSLPIHVGMMQRAFQHLDDGVFCLEKAIRMINSLPVKPVPSPEAEHAEAPAA